MFFIWVLWAVWIFFRSIGLRRRSVFFLAFAAFGVLIDQFLTLRGISLLKNIYYQFGLMWFEIIVLEILVKNQQRKSLFTSYEKINKTISEAQKLNQPIGKVYNFFISYKSEDIALVRRVAEQILASGHNVWFAEYTILLKERDRFDALIAQGIVASQHGICFTSAIPS